MHIARVSQKYVIAALLLVFYVVAEQRTYMKETLWPDSVDRLKVLTWTVLTLTLGFGLIYLPARYAGVHGGVQQTLEKVVRGLTGTDEASVLLGVQSYLETHDLKWLLVKVATGYGNLITLMLVGGGLLLRRVLFQNVPLIGMLRLVLPSFALRPLTQLMEQLEAES
ncbi:MAG: hypothetical protein HY784_10795 [Chloroflexi bacterium]|nr:hypothetical protein [Chloroflexota bacterium]